MSTSSVDTAIGRCLTCDYPLVGLRDPRCPECGRAFDPHDPTTMSSGRLLPWLAGLLVRPVGWPMLGTTIILALMALAATSAPGGYFGLMMITTMAWLGLGTLYMLRILGLAVVTGVWGSGHAQKARPFKRWLVPPITAVCVAWLIGAGAPKWIAMQLSTPSMNRLVREHQQMGQAMHEPSWVGVYPVERFERFPTGFRFLIAGTQFIDAHGFAYFPHTTPPNAYSEDYYEPIGGGWYEWTEGF